MRLRTLSPVLVLAATLLTTSARADVVVERPIVRPISRAPYLALVTAVPSRGLPREDAASAQADVRRHFGARRRQLQSCLAGADLREDPLRGRVRRIELRLRFERGVRPSGVTVHRDEGMPPSARGCLLELAQGLALSRAPRGELVVRVVYELR